MEITYGRLPTIPEYYKLFINPNVDLTSEPKQCCPFHKEDTPSFSYSADRGIWRCFGACKCGGDVIDLHRKNHKIVSRGAAEISLCSIFRVDRKPKLDKVNIDFRVNEQRVKNEKLYQEALLLADRPERWLELDYLMSKTPVDYFDMQDLINKWKNVQEDWSSIIDEVQQDFCMEDSIYDITNE